jgi:hypothetical protein
MAWINNETGKMYYAGSITIIHNGVLFSGIPTEEQLTEWGFVEYIPPEPPEPTPEDELDDFEALQIITEGGTE